MGRAFEYRKATKLKRWSELYDQYTQGEWSNPQ